MELTEFLNAADMLDKARRGARDEAVSKIDPTIWERLNRAKSRATFAMGKAELEVATGRDVEGATRRYNEARLDRQYYEDLIAAYLYAASQEGDNAEQN